MSRTIFYGPKDVRAIEVRLYLVFFLSYWHCGQLLQWLSILLSISCSDVMFSSCHTDIVVSFFNDCPLCFLFRFQMSCFLPAILTLWSVSSRTAHFAFCFVSVCTFVCFVFLNSCSGFVSVDRCEVSIG